MFYFQNLIHMSNIKILITGANGQLGKEFLNYKNKIGQFYFTDIKELDVSDKSKIISFVRKNKITHIINCAAYTNVDQAENNKNLAIEINDRAVNNLVSVCEIYNIKLIHFSTDYVYCGKDLSPIDELSYVNPKNYYGFSKREGEKHIESSSSESIVIRTSWLYSSYGKNFVKTIIDKAKNGEIMHIVNDQFGCPTYAKDIVEATFSILNSKKKLNKHFKIFNFSNEGYTNWYDFALKILELKKIKTEIKPISSKKYKSIAFRPNFLVTNKSKIKNIFDLKIPTWESSLKKFIKKK